MSTDKNSVLVTGASGYIGSHLAAALVEQGRDVHVTLRSTSDPAMLEGIKDSITIHVCDEPGEYLSPVFDKAGIGTVYHLAAFTDHRESNSFEAMINANYVFGAHLLQEMHARGVKNFITTGSFSEHAGGTEALQPQNIYAATKAALYPLVDYYAGAGMAAVTVKLFDVYGPNDRRPKLLGALKKAVDEGSTLDVSEGTQNTSYIHISDAVAALLHAEGLLEQGKHRTYFAPGPEVKPLRNYIETFAALAGRDDLVNFGARPHDDNIIMNPYVGEVLPGWAAAVKAEEGFRELLEDSTDSRTGKSAAQ